MNSNSIKAVYLDAQKCNGCVTCMKACPTEAIRVRNSKAVIDSERCMGCGECVKVCPANAKKEYYDKLDISGYKYTVVLPSPSLYGQFNNLDDVNILLTALKSYGFDDVFEVAYAAEIISAATKQYLSSPDVQKPIISSDCPAVLQYIQMKYEHIVPHISPLIQPEELAAKLALEEAVKKTGLPRKDIGIFLTTQCAAKTVSLKSKGCIDKFVSNKDVYFAVLGEMKRGEGVLPLSRAGRLGVNWGSITGESYGLGTDNYLCADGFCNIKEVLNELEREKLNKLDFIELYACSSGCVGGSLNIENPYLARTRLRILRKKLEIREVDAVNPNDYFNKDSYKPLNVFRLDDDMIKAIEKTMKVKQIYDSLPQLDCGACGSPRCMAFAEDVVRGQKIKCMIKSLKNTSVDKDEKAVL